MRAGGRGAGAAQYFPLRYRYAYTVMQYPARARSIPVFHVDIRLYAIGSTDRQTYVHEEVMEITPMWGSLRLAPIKA